MKTPKRGMNMLLWTSSVTEQHFPIFDRLKECGFDGAEIPVVGGDAAQYRTVRQGLDGSGLASTVVTSLSPEANAVSPHLAVRKKAIEHMKWAIEMCNVLGAEVLTGPFHSAYKVFTGNAPTPDELRWSAEVMRASAEFAGEAGVVLAVEPLNRFECYLLNTPEQARELIDMVDHPAFGMNYDTHHANIEVKDPDASIRAAAGTIRHIHVSENDRGTPGRGQVRWRETFAALHAIGYDGWLTIEAFSTADPEFATAIHVWRDFSDSEEIYREGLRFIDETWRATA